MLRGVKSREADEVTYESMRGAWLSMRNIVGQGLRLIQAAQRKTTL